MQEGRLYVHELAQRAPTLDELRERGLGLPRRGILDAYLLRTRGSAAKYELGAWAWALHRLTAIGLVAYVIAHVFLLLGVANQDELKVSLAAHAPYYQIVLVLAVGALTFHSLNGLRLVLGDGGSELRREVPVQRQRTAHLRIGEAEQ